MKTKNTIIYFCDYCNKLYQRKFHCEKHENLCKKNPENIPVCYGCMFLEMVHEKHDFEVHYDDFNITRIEKRNISILKCNKLNIYVKPILSEKRNKKINAIGFNSIVMPLNCEFKQEL